MSGGKGSQQLTVFWWVLAAMLGAGAGATAAATQGLPSTIWAIARVGLPILVVVGVLEWTAVHPGQGKRTRWREAGRPVAQPPRGRNGSKLAPRRAQLHAITGRKTADPPASGEA
jgi:hypothetical protein